ncbi:MAG: fused MFS/spermidine synthase, partial [Deltaproteobacteria bacterium]|nr:fused MFS/spermidine synthase [Deltaproteobacteria bacterium]
FHSDPKDVAVIGCGSGVTVGSALAANPARVTLVELESAVVEAAALFEEVNRAPWRDARTRVIEDDGRNYLTRTRERFDVIISEPSNPWMTGAASLFTVEFFRIAQARLRPQGVFLQWLQIYELAPERIASVLKTFQSVFPHVLVFSAHVDSNDLLLVGSAEPLRADWAQLTERFTALAPELKRAELKHLEDLLALLLITDEHIAALPADTPLNTDDNAFVEFGAPRDLLTFAEEDPEVPFLDGTRGQRAAIVLAQSSGDAAGAQTRAVELARGYLRQGNPEDARAAALLVQGVALPNQRRHAAETLALAQLFEEDDREVVVDGEAAKKDPEYAALSRLVQDGDDELALEEMEKRPEVSRRSAAHTLLYGFLLYRNGEYSKARRMLLKAQEGITDPARRPAIAYYLAKQAFEAGDFERAISDMSGYRALRNGRAP